MALCPFRAKYKSAIEEHLPDVNLVEGSHAVPGEKRRMIAMFRSAVKDLLTQLSIAVNARPNVNSPGKNQRAT